VLLSLINMIISEI